MGIQTILQSVLLTSCFRSTAKAAFDALRTNFHDTARAHLKLAGELRDMVHKPLEAMALQQKQRRKDVILLYLAKFHFNKRVFSIFP